MTIRQRIMKLVYPLVLRFSKWGGKASVLQNKKDMKPAQSIYDLSVQLNNGTTLPLSSLKGKKILVVNTASNCGYTGQYSELQQLHQQYGDRVAVIGFPANDFKEQEKGSDEEIAQFCQVNFGVSFPLAKKSTVIKGGGQNPLYQWLTQAGKNGWNDQQPNWNFSKYIINENGVLTHYFDAGVSPLSEEVTRAIES
jgi:glutathione peroxidase